MRRASFTCSVRLGLLGTALAFALAPAARAAETVASTETAAPAATPPPAVTPAPPPARVLNGHTFQPSMVVRSPFTTTNFAISADLGLGSATGPKYDLSGNERGEQEYTYTALGQGLSYEWAFLPNWSARLDYVMSLYSGIDGLSVAVVGVTVNVGVGGGLAWTRPLSDTWQLGAGLDFSYAPQLNVLIAAALQEAIAGNGWDPASVFQLDNVLTVRPAVSAAWAPMPQLGFVGRLAYSNSSIESTAGETLYRHAIIAGLSGEFDFGTFTRVPVAITASSRISVPFDESSNTVVDGVLGLAYTGRPNLALGTEVAFRSYRIRPELEDTLDSKAVLVQFALRHYW